MKEQDKLELGGVAAGYLHALRALMEAQSLYFAAYAEQMGTYMAEQKMEQDRPLFAAVEALIQGELEKRVRNWAIDAKRPSTI